MVTGFKAAESSPYNYSWSIIAEMLPDEELSQGEGLKKLRLRSRQLVKDNLIVAGLLQSYVNLICGVNPKVRSNSRNRIQKEQINKMLKETRAFCDVTGTSSLTELNEQIVSQAFINGDVLINLPIDKNKEGIKTVIELIEADRVDTPNEYDTYSSDKLALVRNGVQYSDKGQVEGYWVKKSHKVGTGANSKNDYDFYPRYRNGRLVTWLFKAPMNSRPTVSRQYPVLTPAILLFKQLDDYMEAVIVGARVAACFSAFIKSANPVGTFDSMSSEDASGNLITDSVTERRVTRLQPGLITYLKKNEEVQFASPNKPSDNFDAFIVRIFKMLAMYLRIPYPVAFLDMTDVNYSQWRGAMMEAMKLAGRWRVALEDYFFMPVLNTWVMEAILREMVRGGPDPQIVIGWTNMGTLDPEKEARAYKTMLVSGQISLQMMCEEQDKDYEQLRAERLEEKLNQIEDNAIALEKIKKLEEEKGIIINDELKGDPGKEERDRELRPGEEEAPKEDEETAKERRKDDGNW